MFSSILVFLVCSLSNVIASCLCMCVFVCGADCKRFLALHDFSRAMVTIRHVFLSLLSLADTPRFMSAFCRVCLKWHCRSRNISIRTIRTQILICSMDMASHCLKISFTENCGREVCTDSTLGVVAAAVFDKPHLFLFAPGGILRKLGYRT